MNSSASAFEKNPTDPFARFLRGRAIRVCLGEAANLTLVPLLLDRLRRCGAETQVFMTPGGLERLGKRMCAWLSGRPVATEASALTPAEATLVFAAQADDAAALSKHKDDAHLVPALAGGGETIVVSTECDVAAMVARAARALSSDPLRGASILLTSGPTRGAIDPVRFISNLSSGRLGADIARELFARGADLHMVSGPATEPPPSYVNAIRVESSEDMLRACETVLRERVCDAAIFAAAVNDYIPDNAAGGKIRSGGELQLKFRHAPRVITEVDRVPRPAGAKPLLKVGFKLETAGSDAELLDTARAALRSNGCRLLVANNLSDVGPERHRAWILSENAEPARVESKRDIAAALADLLGRALRS